ncbi:CAP domain-containing protein [Desulfatitalea alkaliphila]|uniref:CAP domain-containing protein n=1 Tax=Desulfatitalea alkaliphila TaxID=2929485 RepID=A0AA41R208_9BACT|nr:CAP domain-containing protein [Desulfatitalea alkaliphila]MCJ8499385.1 CAP domain-containing protein [Desulfatitalea alkaliphila]
MNFCDHIKYKMCILMAALSVLLITPFSGRADFREEMATQLLHLFNSARSNPAGVAATIGVSADELALIRPGLAPSLDHGLPPLEAETVLGETARRHTAHMLATNHFAYDDPDGLPLAERLRRQGYFARLTGEGIGLVGFFNFIDPQQAVGQIFDSLLRRELDPSRSAQLTFLQPAFQHVGIAFDSGPMMLNGLNYNVYMVTCYFGQPLVFEKSEMRQMSRQLTAMINQFRADPAGVVQSLGLDAASFFAESAFPPDDFLYAAAPPLVSNAVLELVAGRLADETGGVPHEYLAPNPEHIAQQLSEAGYIPVQSAYTLSMAALSDIGDGRQALDTLFTDLVLGEMAYYRTLGTLKLLDERVKDIGVAIAASVHDPWTGGRSGDISATVLLGVTPNSDVDYIVGSVYIDKDHNWLHNLGEGLAGIRVTLASTAEDEHHDAAFRETVTNDAGTFAIPVDQSGAHEVRLYIPGDEPVDYWVQTEGANVLLDHSLLPR